MEVVRIGDTRNRVFLHPLEVLKAVAPEAERMTWAILDLREAFAPEGSELDVLDVQHRVEERPMGLLCQYDELLRFVAGLQQVVDGLFVGCTDPARIPARDDTDAVVLARSDIVVAAFDSSFWIVGADDNVAARLRAQFEDVVTEDPEAVTLSAWGR